jgi:hypothetical protein
MSCGRWSAGKRAARAQRCRWAVGLDGRSSSGAVLSCGGERAALLRGQSYYDDNQYERALSSGAIWSGTNPSSRPSDFARYAYLRGMTDYRLGFHADARHWLGSGQSDRAGEPGRPGRAWLPRLDGALADLDRETFGTAGGQPIRASIEPAVIDAPVPHRRQPADPQEATAHAPRDPIPDAPSCESTLALAAISSSSAAASSSSMSYIELPRSTGSCAARRRCDPLRRASSF